MITYLENTRDYRKKNNSGIIKGFLLGAQIKKTNKEKLVAFLGLINNFSNRKQSLLYTRHVLSSLHGLTHLILTTKLGRYNYHPHFQDEERNHREVK